MKSVLFSYILHYPFLFAFRWGYRRISQRICQRHGKIARKHFIYKDKIRLDSNHEYQGISRNSFRNSHAYGLRGFQRSTDDGR